MKFQWDIPDLLWATLRGLDLSTDKRKNAPPILQLRQQMLLAIAGLNNAKPDRTRTKRATQVKRIPMRPLARNPRDAT